MRIEHMTGFEYCVISYVHDIVRNERINVGVVLREIDSGDVHLKIGGDTNRLKSAFPDFSIEGYMDWESSFLATTIRTGGEITSLRELMCRLNPDNNLCIQYGDIMCGLTHNPNDETEHLFRRMVA